MRHLRHIVLAALAVAMCVAPVASAHDLDRTVGRSLSGTAVGSNGLRGWTERPSLQHARVGLDVATVNGRILAIGGFDYDLPEQFDFVEERRVGGTGTWRTIAPLPTARANLATAELDGFVYAVGGYEFVDATDVVERFDPRTGSWIATPSLPLPRAGMGAAGLGGLLYVAGGEVLTRDGDYVFTDSLIAYNPRTRTWTSLAPMAAPRWFHRVVSDGRYLYAVGGFDVDLQPLSSVERYDPRSNTWRAIAPMILPRVLPGVCAIESGRQRLLVVIAGGDGEDVYRSTEVYDLSTGRWRMLPAQLPQGRVSLGCAVEADGSVLAIGGSLPVDGAGHATGLVEALRVTN